MKSVTTRPKRQSKTEPGQQLKAKRPQTSHREQTSDNEDDSSIELVTFDQEGHSSDEVEYQHEIRDEQGQPQSKRQKPDSKQQTRQLAQNPSKSKPVQKKAPAPKMVPAPRADNTVNETATQPDQHHPVEEIIVKVSLDHQTHEPTEVETIVHPQQEQAAEAIQVLPGLAVSTPEEAAAMQPAILEQLEHPDDLPTEPMVPASVVQHAYGMELVPEAKQPAEKPQRVHLEPSKAKKTRQKKQKKITIAY
ncbi:MAG: hypothetical protein ACAI44_33930 [Candidatus Sericytochromatia bacterium]